jgi:hypothetical protein
MIIDVLKDAFGSLSVPKEFFRALPSASPAPPNPLVTRASFHPAGNPLSDSTVRISPERTMR